MAKTHREMMRGHFLPHLSAHQPPTMEPKGYRMNSEQSNHVFSEVERSNLHTTNA